MPNEPTNPTSAVPDLSIQTDAYQITPTGIAFNRDLEQHEWEALGSKLGEVGRSVQWLIGDWLAYGEGKGQWGDTYTEAMRITGLDYTTLRNYANVSRKVQLSVRTYNLSWEHHRKVAPLKTTEDQKKWLKKAEDAAKKGEPISSRRLAKSIIVGRVVKKEEMMTPPAERGKDNVHPHVNRIVVWWGKMKRAGWLDRAEDYQLTDLMLDLQPVIDIAAELRAKLKELEAEEADE
ncbi:MAG: hypothetical protein Q7P63_01240 [Verrucomicrobiota bacterium JB022]|nr:hypothetical protein [Verrucomicrobiota bacterium JB022]